MSKPSDECVDGKPISDSIVCDQRSERMIRLTSERSFSAPLEITGARQNLPPKPSSNRKERNRFKTRAEIRRARAERNRCSARRSRLKKKREQEIAKKTTDAIERRNKALKQRTNELKDKMIGLQRVVSAMGLEMHAIVEVNSQDDGSEG